MIGRVILAVLLAGIAAGLVMGAIQHVRLTPLILDAEAFERAGVSAGHSHDASISETATAQPEADGHDHSEGWGPDNGWQRTLATTVTAAMTGAGFAAILAGLSLLIGVPITRRNGILWGLCGFLAVTLAPAVGLPPQLPGMAESDLFARQVWWVCTIAATAAGIYLIATQTLPWALVLAAMLILAPHLVGAPVPPHGDSVVPAELVARFVANSIAANAVFWCFIGLFLGLVLDRSAKDLYTS